MKVAVLGTGGREHAFVWKLMQDLPEEDVFLLPGNAGVNCSYPIDVSDFKALEQFCCEQGVGLIIVGPEAPLAEGIVDYFRKTDIKIFGPSQEATQLESSKIWAKQFMERHGVATAGFWSFERIEDAYPCVASLEGNLVVKYDGLAGGKGVTVCSSTQEAHTALKQLQDKYGNEVPFLIEERLEGEEVSVIGFTDGKSFSALLPAQDHKRALEGDCGPNTGGMGAFCPASFCDERLLSHIDATIIQPTLKGIAAEGLDYKGVIYFGVMMTPLGPRLLEYNTRFGDPEAEILLPALQTSFLEVVQACLEQRLSAMPIAMHPGYFVDVVLTSDGYPGDYTTGKPIVGLEQLDSETLVFHAGTRWEGESLVTAGGRVLNIVCKGDTLEQAIDKVYRECSKIHFEGMTYRKDIAHKGLRIPACNA
tara:strand:- start:2105 stop:3367 length:1263 start_codon:yes stop_codon:yes gene_type:complete